MTAAALIAQATSRIEIGTAVVPLQSRHPVALLQQSLSTQLVAEGRFTLGLGPSHHWIIEDMLGLPYERPAALTADYLDVLDAAMAGPGPVDVENERFTIHNPMHVTDEPRMQVLLAALGPVMLQARRVAHRRHDPVARRREGDRVAHRAAHQRRGGRGRPAGAAHRRRRAGLPVPAERGRRGQGPRRPRAQRGHRVAQLPAPARPGRRDRRVRHPRLRRRGDDPGPPRRRSRPPASPTSPCASCRSATAATNSSSRAAAPASSSPPWPPTADRDSPTVVHRCQAPTASTVDVVRDLQFGDELRE